MVDKELMNESIAADLFSLWIYGTHLDDGSFGTLGMYRSGSCNSIPMSPQRRMQRSFSRKLFLLDAEDFWIENDPGSELKWLWSEIDRSGNECHLEASAVCLKKEIIDFVVKNCL